MEKLLKALLLFFCCSLNAAEDDQVFDYAKQHQTFRDVFFKTNEEAFVRLAKEGQAPRTLFIGCSDSRVMPELITNSRPGELFVVRTAGNFVPPFTSGSSDGVVGTIEYGVNVLGVTDIVVCGHSQCGAIAGLYQDLSGKNLDALVKWIQLGEPAKKLVQESLDANTPEAKRNAVTEKASIVFQLKNLLTYPFIKDRVSKGELTLHGWWFNIQTGQIEAFDPNDYDFDPLT